MGRVRWRRCTHYDGEARRSTIEEEARWYDTAGLEWLEEECRRCRRVWRQRTGRRAA